MFYLSITEEEYLDEWLQIIFGSLEKRKKHAEKMTVKTFDFKYINQCVQFTFPRFL